MNAEKLLMQAMARTAALGRRALLLRVVQRLSVEVDPRSGRHVTHSGEQAGCVARARGEASGWVNNEDDLVGRLRQAHEAPELPWLELMLPTGSPRAVLPDAQVMNALADEVRAKLKQLPVTPHVLLLSAEASSSWVATEGGIGAEAETTLQWMLRVETPAGAIVESAATCGDRGPAPLEEVWRRLRESAECLVDAQSAPDPQAPVVLHPALGAAFLAGLVPMFDGAVAARTPGLAQSVGKRLFPACVSVMDDPQHPQGGCARRFDDEGTPCQPVSLVDAGQLKSFLHSQRTARALGAEATGRGFFHTGLDGLGPRPANLFIVPGQTELPPDYTELTVRLETFTLGHQGRVTVIAGGYKVKDGRRVARLRPLDLNLPALEVFRKVKGVGQGLTFFPVLGGLGAPVLWVEPLWARSH